MGSYTTPGKLYKPANAETGWDDEVNTNFDRLAEQGVNVRAFGAVGDGTTDDATALQAAIDAADAGGVVCVFPPGSTGIYRVNTALNWPIGVKLLAIGGKLGTPAGRVMIRYQGGAISTGVLRVTDVEGSTLGTWMEGISIHANSLADYCVEFVSTTGKLDSSSYFWNCQFGSPVKSGILYGSGMTNHSIQGCRWDSCPDYAMEITSNDTDISRSFSIRDFTFDTGAAQRKGFIRYDSSGGFTAGPSRLHLEDATIEINSTTAPGFTEGLINCIEPNTETGNKVMLRVHMDSVHLLPTTANTNALPIIKTRNADATAGNRQLYQLTADSCSLNERVLVNDGSGTDIDTVSSPPFPRVTVSPFDSSPTGMRAPTYQQAVEWWATQTHVTNPATGHLALYAENEILKTKDSAGVIRALADHTHASAGLQAGTIDHGVITGLTDDDHTQYQKESEKGAASGYASLGSDSLVPQDQLGTGTQDGTKFLRDDGTWQAGAGGVTDHGALTGLSDDDHTQYRLESADHTHASTGLQAGTIDHGVITGLTDDDHTQYQKESEKGAASGYASLGADTLVPQDQLGTGTQDGTKFLRDDGTWQLPATIGLGRFKSGLYYANGDLTTAAAPTLNVLAVSPSLFVHKTTTFNELVMNVTVAAATSVFRMGIYQDDGGGYPGALVADFGTVDCSTTGLKTLTISQQLTPDVYWIGGVMQTASATITMTGPFLNHKIQVGTSSVSAGPNNNYYAQTSVTGALPSTFTSTVTPGSTTMPRIWIKAA